ncbi:MAG: hypothetical protein AAFW46_04150 [Pseudomonadota bacterium]
MTRSGSAIGALSCAILLSAAPAPRAQEVDCAAPACESRLSQACLERLGAGTLPEDDVCEPEQTAYLACLTRVIETCGSERTALAPRCTSEDARHLWPDVKATDDPEILRRFASDCAGTPHASLATALAARMEQSSASAREPDPLDPIGYWEFSHRTGLGFCLSFFRISREAGTFRLETDLIDRTIGDLQIGPDGRLLENGEPTAKVLRRGYLIEENAYADCYYSRRN